MRWDVAPNTTICRQCARSIRDAERNNNRFSSIVLGIVKSAPFQMNVKLQETVATGKRPDGGAQ